MLSSLGRSCCEQQHRVFSCKILPLRWAIFPISVWPGLGRRFWRWAQCSFRCWIRPRSNLSPTSLTSIRQYQSTRPVHGSRCGSDSLRCVHLAFGVLEQSGQNISSTEVIAKMICYVKNVKSSEFLELFRFFAP